MRLRRLDDELSGFYSAAQAPAAADTTDDLWINFQPLPSAFSSSSSSSSSSADGPAAINKSLLRRPDSTTASAVSFGFIAIAILVSMFLVIAIFERILRPRRNLGPLHHTHDLDVEFSEMSQRPLQWGSPAPIPAKPPNISYGKGVSVLMPGHQMPTFIAQPAPIVEAVAEV